MVVTIAVLLILAGNVYDWSMTTTMNLGTNSQSRSKWGGCYNNYGWQRSAEDFNTTTPDDPEEDFITNTGSRAMLYILT